MRGTLTALFTLASIAGCSGAPSGDAVTRGERDEPTAAASSEALTGFAPAFVVDGMSACADVQGAGGVWTAQKGAWSFCRSLRTVHSVGCGYAWSSGGGGAADVDALAVALGSNIGHIGVTGGHAVSGVVNACPVLNRPNPGSTPCGACTVGVATATHVYLSFPAAYEQDVTLGLRTDSQAQSRVIVHVPAHQLSLTEAMTLPHDFARGVTLSLPPED